MSRPAAKQRHPLAVPTLGLAMLLMVGAGAPLRAAPNPYPHKTGAPNPMKAPGLLSSPRLPLGADTRTGYGRFLRLPVQSTPQPLFLGLLTFYRTVVSPVNGDQSDLAPVHSLYAVEAIKSYGVLLGTVLTTERLIHEPSEIPLTPRLTENGRVFHYDPLLNNTYWLWDWLR